MEGIKIRKQNPGGNIQKRKVTREEENLKNKRKMVEESRCRMKEGERRNESRRLRKRKERRRGWQGVGGDQVLSSYT